MSLEEVIKFLKNEINLQDKWKVSLVGIGMGTAETLTAEGKRGVQEGPAADRCKKDAETADPGSIRMLPISRRKSSNYIKEHPEYENVAVLFVRGCGFTGLPGFLRGWKTSLR